MQDLPIIPKTYDLIRWYVPLLNNLPRSHRFILGDRIITGLYELLVLAAKRIGYTDISETQNSGFSKKPEFSSHCSPLAKFRVDVAKFRP